jgi:uncharacterized membrane protein
MNKKLKMFLVGVSGLLLLFTCIGLLIPSSVKISRGAIVQADSITVMKAVANVRTWPLWMNWLHSDKGTLVTFKEDNKNPGVKWASLSKGQSGEIIIEKIEEGELHLHHSFPGLNEANGMIRVRSVGPGQSEVLWMLEYPLRWYPWERFEGIFMDSMVGAALDQALQGLKKYVEQAAS